MFRRSGQRGVTLIELIVTIVLLAIALTTITFTISSGTSRSGDALLQQRAVALGQAYLDEILGKRFDENTRNSGIPPCRASAPPPRQCTGEMDFGPDGVEDRENYDDVDDYHELDEGEGQPTSLQDAEGNTRTGYENYRVQVSVRYINIGSGGEEENLGVDDELDDEFDAKFITVTVSVSSLSQEMNFSAYKSNF